MTMRWQGVMPALTTPFTPALAVDHAALERQVGRMFAAGCTGVVALGSLGEGATLEPDEKREVLRTCVRAAGGNGPVVAGVAALSTVEAVRLAQDAEREGCRGLMVLPPYVYSTDWREMKAHVSAVIGATRLSCMLYNNPVAYRTDFLPEQIVELAGGHMNLGAVKESSADVRRITALRMLAGDRLAVLVGVDDLVLEGVERGAAGWIAGLVNALPTESVALFAAAREGRRDEADRLYRWFLPLLRMDTVPKFVQLIKLVQVRTGTGAEAVRPPRLVLEGEERAAAEAVIDAALRERPRLP